MRPNPERVGRWANPYALRNSGSRVILSITLRTRTPRKEYLSMNRNKRFSLLTLTLILAASTAFAQQKKPAQPVKEYTIEQFMNTVRIGGSSFSSDEKSILFHTNKSSIFNVYSVPVTGGAPAQLTNSTK